MTTYDGPYTENGTYVEANGVNIITYPYLFLTLQTENPTMDFGENYDVTYWFPQTPAATEKGYTLNPVMIIPEPPYDQNTQVCRQDVMPTYLGNIWALNWTVSDMTPAEKAAHDAKIKNQNKTQASSLLSQTDWTAIPSVADPAQSNPYLANQDAFLSYRSQLREIAVNPPATPVTVWPTPPVEVWETV